MKLEKTYSPADIEKKLYKKWLDRKYFHAVPDENKKPFTVIMPPPNITGKLHMGHALDNTIQDIFVRFKRMQGYVCLWLPGTDHASISTEVKVTDALRAEGIDKKEIGREGFLKRTWEWKEEYGGFITEQIKRLGSSCDWDRERFTMDDGCSRAVKTAFVNLYDKGLIYRGEKIINWCPECRTSISDAEVEYEEKNGHFYHLRYPVAGGDDFVQLATTRPETMLGDTAIAVNPDDDRYKDLVGREAVVPLVGRKIPIVADPYVDMEFGTGVVKITPAHDPNDFLVGERHNLDRINILNDDGSMNDSCGPYAGMDRYEARKKIVDDLKAGGFLVEIESHVHNVGTHDRCKTVIEPMIKKQWFVSMQNLIKPAEESVKDGSIKLIPESIDKTFFHWTENIRDWCISRQLWWGHRIPAFYCKACGHIAVSETDVKVCPECGGDVYQDPDTLDTWFSSALWPFSTLGWPDETEDFEYFYPTDLLVTGYDILFFWVIRMIFSGLEHTGKIPFKDVLFHGLVRDADGRKMSKSLGNGIDPIEVIDTYGADALRGSLVSNTTPGNDMRFTYEKVVAARNFANKIWNSARFITMNDETGEINPDTPVGDYTLEREDKWILSGTNKLVDEVTENLLHFDMGIAYDKIVAFARDEFCDWYVEMVKPRLYGDDKKLKDSAVWTLKNVLINILKLLHPFMPFITEEIFVSLKKDEESIMISSWPEFTEEYVFEAEEKTINIIKEAVKAVRNIRADKQVKPSKQIEVFILTGVDEVKNAFIEAESAFKKLAGVSRMHIISDADEAGENHVSAVIDHALIYVPLENLIDIEEEKKKLLKDIEFLKNEIKRCEGMLSNEKFILKAPKEKVLEEREKLEGCKKKLSKLEEETKKL